MKIEIDCNFNAADDWLTCGQAGVFFSFSVLHANASEIQMSLFILVFSLSLFSPSIWEAMFFPSHSTLRAQSSDSSCYEFRQQVKYVFIISFLPFLNGLGIFLYVSLAKHQQVSLEWENSSPAYPADTGSVLWMYGYSGGKKEDFSNRQECIF